MPILDRMKRAWNAFRNGTNEFTELELGTTAAYGTGSPSRPRRFYYSERTIISAIYTTISMDVAGIDLRHIKLDDQGRYLDDMNSSLNDCLTFEPNLDQAPRAFKQDIVLTLFDKGCAAIVPVETTVSPENNDIFDIYSLRVGEIVSWYPKKVRVSVYNEDKGRREEILLEKKTLAIVENPLYSVMNEPNSTLQRLIRKLNLLDTVDEQSSSGKLDIIIQLPYVIKSESRRTQAEQRRKDIEFQLKGSQYGIAYTDGTEKITQLNRPAENNLLKQVEYLTNLLYNQLGLTEEVMNGTADEAAMINYFNRTIEPIIESIAENMQRAFLGALVKRNNERIAYFRDPFRLVPVAQIAEIADKFTRNEILTANEIRQYMGIPPASDPKADMLINSNMPQPNPPVEPVAETTEEDTVVDNALANLDNELTALLDEFGGTE
jgi:hypothetical protein